MKVWEAQIMSIKNDNYYLQSALWCITGLRHNNQSKSCFTRPAKSISVTDFGCRNFIEGQPFTNSKTANLLANLSALPNSVPHLIPLLFLKGERCQLYVSSQVFEILYLPSGNELVNFWSLTMKVYQKAKFHLPLKKYCHCDFILSL